LVGPRTGIGWYTRHLLQGFSFLEDDWTGTVIGNRTLRDEFSDRIRREVIPFPNTVRIRFLWESVLLPARLNRMNFDVWHSPMTVIPRHIGKIATVATVHDIAFLLYPEIQPPRYRGYWTRRIATACHRANRIIAVSESTRRDLLERFEVDPAKVRVVHEAADPFLSQEVSEEELEETRKRFSLPERFLLFVGTLEPRKNLAFLLEVYEEAQRRKVEIPPLVVVGGKGWLQKEVEQRLSNLGDRVRRVGYLDRKDLRAFYGLSDLTLVPSLYEGFGLQALEAMAAGCVVVASDSSSLPEVVGKGGILLPIDRGAGIWLDKILELVDNESACRSWREKGRIRAGSFSWTRAAEETFRVYQEALEMTAQG